MVLGSLALTSTRTTLRKRFVMFRAETNVATSADFPARE
jgi:hypothetical protein